MAKRLPGIRLDRWMERLRGRTESGEPPDVNYSVQPVHLVGDSSDLIPCFLGPRAIFGGLVPNVAGQFSGFQVIAGSRGCRVAFGVNNPSVAAGLIQWRVVGVVTAALASAFTLYQQNPATAGPLDTRVRFGSFAANPSTADAPAMALDASAFGAVGIGLVLVGDVRSRPALWLDPGRILEVNYSTANSSFQLNGSIEEPAQESTP